MDAADQLPVGVAPVVEGVLRQPSPVWRSHNMLVQRDGEVALVREGRLESIACTLQPQAAPQDAPSSAFPQPCIFEVSLSQIDWPLQNVAWPFAFPASLSVLILTGAVLDALGGYDLLHWLLIQYGVADTMNGVLGASQGCHAA